jgi:hypothetical protein
MQHLDGSGAWLSYIQGAQFLKVNNILKSYTHYAEHPVTDVQCFVRVGQRILKQLVTSEQINNLFSIFTCDITLCVK